MPDIKTIREAVLGHRGGLESATDEQIMTIWNALDNGTQAGYLKKEATTTTRGTKNADSPGSVTNL